ncbi:Protein SQS1 [Dissostichus eleginoides]|uniref:Protein SQS1 n=1 Tax=Dissostichus eleginoides TaxID=100907 RepID=A0AAD9C463_DISEL|nr:Protein SQS1 [Dissostichus eleginoides]
MCLSAKRAINTPPPTACTHVMEGKQRGEGEDSKGKDEMLKGGKRGQEGWARVEALVMGSGGQRVKG